MFYWPCLGSFCTTICHTLADFVSLFVTFYPHPPSDVKGLYFLYLLSMVLLYLHVVFFLLFNNLQDGHTRKANQLTLELF